MIDESGRLVVIGNRGGTIGEISAFLRDTENAYVALYSFDRLWGFRKPRHGFPVEFLIELRYPYLPLGRFTYEPTDMEMLPPNARLTLERVRIESPGFWDFAASLNPLQQLREFLNDRHRHRRRQDCEYREESEKERLQLDNELIRRQIEAKDRVAFTELLQLMRDYGYDEEEIRETVWRYVGRHVSQLGRHQDARLIDGAE